MLLLFPGCGDPYQEGIFKAYDELPVAEWLSGQDGRFSMWETMLKKTDLYNALNLGIATYTCFAAEDETVRGYLQEHGYASVDDIPMETLDYLMRYHILYGSKISYSNLLLKLSLPTISGDYLTAGVDLEKNCRYIDNGENKPRSYVSGKDIEAANGVIHILDHVLEPITESVWDALEANPSYSIFAEAISRNGLDAYLDNTYTELNEVTLRDNKTVFVVPDSVFKDNGITDYAALESRIGSGENMINYLKYHIMKGLQGYAQLTTFPQDADWNAMILYSECPLRGLSVRDTLGVVSFNPHSPADEFHISDSRRDMPAKNGYLHEIDGLGTLPSLMARYIVVYEPTDRVGFQTIPFYRSEKTAADPVQEYSLIDNGLEVSGIRWESVPASKAKVWYYSSYEEGRYLNCDAIYWNMGDIGWIEFDIPVLPLGNYTLFAEKSNDSTLGGKSYIYWDGEEASLAGGSEINFISGVKHPTWATHNITKEETHTIRFTVGSTSGIHGIDRFIFKPKI